MNKWIKNNSILICSSISSSSISSSCSSSTKAKIANT